MSIVADQTSLDYLEARAVEEILTAGDLRRGSEADIFYQGSMNKAIQILLLARARASN